MEQETTDENQTLQTGEEAVQEQETETTESEVDVEALRKQNAQLYARATKAEAKAKQLEGKTVSTETNTQGSSSTAPDERFDRLELKTDGYSSEETDLIMSLGGKSVLQNPVVQKAIEGLRKEAKSKSATPTGTAKSPIFQKYSAKDLKTIPLNEFEEMVSPEM